MLKLIAVLRVCRNRALWNERASIAIAALNILCFGFRVRREIAKVELLSTRDRAVRCKLHTRAKPGEFLVSKPDGDSLIVAEYLK